MDTMTENDYLIAWGLYAFAALGCLLVWCRMTRFMWRWLREPLRVLMAVLLFSPTIIDPVKEKFAPAVAIAALDLAFKVGDNAWRAVSDLLMYAIIALCVYLVFVLIRWPIERAGKARKAQAAAAAKARQADPEDDQPFGSAGDDRYAPKSAPRASGPSRVEPRL
ncbi:MULTISPECIES: MFS transporter [Pseudomonas]|uniref:MFS transporter n=1 Tax=Pseudomonas TaxID=286 RepID=UPI001EF15D09|nr:MULTISPECIES: MFS transporter [Pseudomonas]MCF3195584.1 MFS transporter [Pseudomonas bubulae]MCF6761924.1 MFS transporter [Pseudomonas fragi]